MGYERKRRGNQQYSIFVLATGRMELHIIAGYHCMIMQLSRDDCRQLDWKGNIRNLVLEC